MYQRWYSAALFLLEMVFSLKDQGVKSATPTVTSPALVDANDEGTTHPPPMNKRRSVPMKLTLKSDDRSMISFFAGRLNLKDMV